MTSKIPDQIRAKKEAELKNPKGKEEKEKGKGKKGEKDDCRLF